MNGFSKSQEEALKAIVKQGNRTFIKGSILKSDGTKVHTNTLNSLAKTKNMLIKENDYYTVIEPRFNEYGYYFTDEVKRMREINYTKEKRDFINEYLNGEEGQKIPSDILSAINDFVNSKGGIFYDEYKDEAYLKINEDNHIVTLKRKNEILNGESSDCNFLLEGDNYYALKKIEKTHANKIDIIYIDPPYNTGNKEFVYNDKMIGEDDSYRHSKWLSFMHDRLIIAKTLLKDDGVIFISIDDNEQARLKILCDEIFGEKNFITQFTWHKKIRPSNKLIDKANNRSKGISSNIEYILCYRKNIKNIIFTTAPLDKEYIAKNYRNPDNDPRGLYTTKPLWANSNNNPMKTLILPDGTERTEKWFCNQETLNDLFKNNMIHYSSRSDGFRQKVFLSSAVGQAQMNFLDAINYGTSEDGTNEYKEISKEANFSNPKPIKLIKHLIGLIPNKNAIVLDFFAGSGTTGQATLELNKEDGGNRHFILCTNNENNICENVTYQRLNTVITGIRKDGTEYSNGIKTNLIYDTVNADNKISNNEDILETESLKIMNTISVIKTIDDLEKILNNLTPEIKAIYLDDDFEGLNEDEREKLINNNIIILNDF